MPKFRGPINLHLGFDAKAGKPEVSSEYDAGSRNYVVRIEDALKKKWRDALEAHGFREEPEPDKAPEQPAAPTA
jgi:hypothetical protein